MARQHTVTVGVHAGFIDTDMVSAIEHKLAARITDHYEQVGLPRYYVITLFHLEQHPELHWEFHADETSPTSG